MELECMSEFELLTATQACMVYFIMCIIEASSENDALSSELLQVLYVSEYAWTYACMCLTLSGTLRYLQEVLRWPRLSH